MDTSDARNNQPDRKHERAPTPDAARPPRHAPDPTHESRVLVVLHPLSPPATSSDNPGHHAHRHSPRKCLATRHPNPPNHRHHPRQGRRNLLQPTPPHHPLPQHLELTPSNTFYPITLEFQRFWGISKNDRDKLRAKFGWRWSRCRPLRPSAPRASIGALARCPAPPPTGSAAGPCGPSGALHAGGGGGFAALGAGCRRVAGVSWF